MLRTVTHSTGGGQCGGAPALLQSGPDASRARRSDCFQPRATARRRAPLGTVRVLPRRRRHLCVPCRPPEGYWKAWRALRRRLIGGSLTTNSLRSPRRNPLCSPPLVHLKVRPSLGKPSTAAIYQKERARRSRAPERVQMARALLVVALALGGAALTPPWAIIPAMPSIGTTLHPRLLLRMRSIGHTKPPPSKVEMEPLKRVCEPTATKMEEKGCKAFTESTLTTMA